MPSTRRAVCLGLATVLAGCTSDSSSAPSRTPTDTASSTATGTPGATDSPTPEPVGTGANPNDLVVRNASGTERTVTVTVEGESTVFDDELTLPPNDRVTFDVDFPRAGTYVVRAEAADGPEADEYEWQATKDPDGWVTVRIRDDAVETTYAIA